MSVTVKHYEYIVTVYECLKCYQMAYLHVTLENYFTTSALLEQFLIPALEIPSAVYTKADMKWRN